MRIELEDDGVLGIDLAPLIDCMFLLLIFFLVATTLKKQQEQAEKPFVKEQTESAQELRITLPDAAISAGEDRSAFPIFIQIDRNGRFGEDGRILTRRELHDRVREIARVEKRRHVRLEVDRNAPSSRLIELLDLLSYEGVSNYGIQTLPLKAKYPAVIPDVYPPPGEAPLQ